MPSATSPPGASQQRILELAEIIAVERTGMDDLATVAHEPAVVATIRA